MDLDRDAWRFVTNDAAGIVSDLVELRPDLLARIPVIPYRDSSESWDTLCTDGKGSFIETKSMGALSETEAVAWMLALHG